MEGLDSGAPILGSLTAEERASAAPEEGRIKAAEALEKEGFPGSNEAESMGYRTFVAAREHSQGRFLVKPGKLVTIAPLPGSTPGILPAITREGDVWASFSGGVLTTNDERVIAWCENHPKVCRDATNPTTPGWAALKDLQARVATRDVTLPPDVDVDAMFDFPEALGQSSGGEDARALVEGARTSQEKRESVERERKANTERLSP